MPPRIITSEWYPESRFGACFPYICLRVKPYLQGVAILLSTASQFIKHDYQILHAAWGSYLLSHQQLEPEKW